MASRNAPQSCRSHLVVAVFFRVTHDGLNETGTTRSLSFELTSPGENKGPQAPWKTCAARREHLNKQVPSVNFEHGKVIPAFSV